MGNEAMARGALEAGVSVATGYPGNPSTEIIDSLSVVADEMNVYVEWSVNEKVALEVAAAAALSSLNALTAMKQNGLNVALDFLSNLNLSGIQGAMVLIVCDDPGGLSSTNEQDSRVIARLVDVPLLEPATVVGSQGHGQTCLCHLSRLRNHLHDQERDQDLSCAEQPGARDFASIACEA